MYAPFFGLRKAPFSIAPDPHYLYMSERHREALAHLLFGLEAGGGFVLLTGEIGAGKTTVCRCFLEQVPAHCRVAYIFNPRLSVPELLRTVCDEFHIAVPAGASSVKAHLDPLNAHLLAEHAAGRHCVLIVDEAQNLSADVLEQLRLLTNLETSERKLLQIILIGQPELRHMLAQPALEQLAQRVIARYHLGPLTDAETGAYVRHRLSVAGLQGPLPFDRAALHAVHRLSAGVPRRINLLCDRALLGAWAHGLAKVDVAHLKRAAAEVFFSAEAGPGEGTQPSRRWQRVAAALATLVLAGGAIAWALWSEAPWVGPMAWRTGAGGHDAQPARGSAPPAASSAASAAPVGTAASAASGASAASTASAAEAAAASASVAPRGGAAWAGSTPAAHVPTAASAPAAVAAPGPTWVASDWWVQLDGDEAGAWRALASQWDQALPKNAGAAPCAALARNDLVCYRIGNGSLGLVRLMDRPVLLVLHGMVNLPPRWVLLVGLDAQSAWLHIHGQIRRLPLAELATHWRGELATLWRAPAAYADRTRAPEALERDLLRLLAPLPETQGAGTVAGQLRAFQATQGLQPDGLPGPITWMRLNLVRGVPEPRLRTSP